MSFWRRSRLPFGHRQTATTNARETDACQSCSHVDGLFNARICQEGEWVRVHSKGVFPRAANSASQFFRQWNAMETSCGSGGKMSRSPLRILPVFLDSHVVQRKLRSAWRLIVELERFAN